MASASPATAMGGTKPRNTSTGLGERNGRQSATVTSGCGRYYCKSRKSNDFRKPPESRFFDVSAAAKLSRANTKIRGSFCWETMLSVARIEGPGMDQLPTRALSHAQLHPLRR
jgi:hypothetical protein